MPTWPNRPAEYYLAALQHDDFRVRRQAAAALGVLGDTQAVEPLLLALVEDQIAEVRENAAYALGQLEDARAVEPLKTAALGDPDSQVRSTAMRALDHLKIAHPVEVHLAALRDPDWTVRYWAIRALGEDHDARAVAPLMELLKGDDKTLGPVLSVALGQLGKPAMLPLLDAMQHVDPMVRAQTVLALGPIADPEAHRAIEEALRDKDDYVRAHAQVALNTQTYEAFRRQRGGGEASEEE